MSPEAKRLKLIGLVTMFAGLAVLVYAIVCAVQAFDLTDALQGAAGLGSVLVGAQGARLANVPSTAGKIVVPAIIVFVAGAALAAASYVLVSPPAIVQIAVIVVASVLVLLVGIFAKAIVEMLKRK